MKSKLIFIWMISGISCSSLPTKTNSLFEDNKLSQIKIGSSANLVKQELGEPSRKNLEKISGSDYTVWEYGSEDKPIGFITLDLKNNRLISKSIWLYKKNEVEEVIKNHFKNSKFKKYIPCDLRGVQTVLIDTQNGILLATKERTVELASWSEPEFTKLRAKQFDLKCPQLQ